MEKYNFIFKVYWSNGILVWYNKIDVVLMISYINGLKGKGVSLKYELRDDSLDLMYYLIRLVVMWIIFFLFL